MAMSNSGRTSFVYGLYLGLLGLALLVAPHPVLRLIDFPTEDPYWPRSTGVLACVIAVYAIQAGRTNLIPIIRWSVYCRIFAFLFFTIAVIVGIAVPAIFFLGLIDLFTAIWSHRALRLEQAAAEGA